MNKLVNRFLRYITFDTQSDENSQTFPSTGSQTAFANQLIGELTELGLTEVKLYDNAYVIAKLQKNTSEKYPSIGFLAHMDTSPDFSGKDIHPQIINNYSGNEITLDKNGKIILSPNQFPELKNYIHQDLIVTDGTTLLGADNKAGIAEIITAIERIKNSEIKHGDIYISFTPDEEIGTGIKQFPLDKFPVEFAYTIDGGEIGELEYENFNAAMANITIHGTNVHPGDAKNKMVNSIILATELIHALPHQQRPEHTENYEGFFHLTKFTGEPEKTHLQLIIRDHDKGKFEHKKAILNDLIRYLNKKYGQKIIHHEIKDQYYNMREKIEPVYHIVDLAILAMEISQVTPKIKPIRGGTDGAQLSYMGLPTPNIFSGGHNFHGKFEYIPVQSMEKAVEVIINIIKLSNSIYD